MLNTFSRFIGACCKDGQTKSGVELAPIIIKKALGIQDMPMIENFQSDIGYKDLFNIHNSLIKKDLLPITIGGDHSIAFSTVASSVEYFKDDLTVIWVDAHADIHTRFSSLTNNLHGMPLGGLLGHDNIFNFQEIQPSQLIYIGLRDVEEYEQQKINDLGIENYTAEDIKNTSLTEILEKIYNTTEYVHMSVDVDVIDPEYFKSTGTPVDNGLTIKDTKEIISKFRPKIKSIDFVEFNPLLTDPNQSNKDLNTLKQLISIVH